VAREIPDLHIILPSDAIRVPTKEYDDEHSLMPAGGDYFCAQQDYGGGVHRAAWVCPADSNGYVEIANGAPRWVAGGTIEGVTYGLYSSYGPYSPNSPPQLYDCWLLSDPYMANPEPLNPPAPWIACDPIDPWKIDARAIWAAVKPRPNDFICWNLNGWGIIPHKVGCEFGDGFPMSSRHDGIGIQAFCLISAPTPFMPSLFERLPKGSSILGAWAKVFFRTLRIQTQRMNLHAEATWHSSYPYGWEWAPDQIDPTRIVDTVSDQGYVGFAVLGLRRDPMWGWTFDLLTTISTPPALNWVVSGNSVWCDVTHAARAVWENWSGKGYFGFGLIPYDPTMQWMLTAAQAWENSGMLARLWPQITHTVRRSTDPFKVFGACLIDLDIECKMVSYDHMELEKVAPIGDPVNELWVAFQLPAERCERLLSYGDYPPLVP